MKPWIRNTLSIVLSSLIVGIFITTCVFTYLKGWNLSAFWWSWIALIWLSGLLIGGYIFYKQNKTDEIKTFWLLVMIALPIVGSIIAIIFNWKLKTNYGMPNNDHSKLQKAIFNARKVIKIYSDSFFASIDTFNALNFAIWKNVKIQLIISIQKSKAKQEFLIYHLRKKLENKIKLHLTEKKIDESFVIIDDKYVITTSCNFNFNNVYSKSLIKESKEVFKYEKKWNTVLERTSLHQLKKNKTNVFKKFKYWCINIFYPFL